MIQFSLDNDGDALADGALYFNTTDNVMKVYDLGNTQWKQLTPTASQQTNIDAAVANATNINSVASNLPIQQIMSCWKYFDTNDVWKF